MQEMKARILCVDNDADTCEMLRTLLGNAGYEVVVAHRVTEGLRLAKNDPCDLILLDWYFDDGAGLELCQMIRPFSKVPIVFYTGEAGERSVKTAVNAGAQGYLIKPCPIAKLLRAIGLLISQGKVAELNTSPTAKLKAPLGLSGNSKQQVKESQAGKSESKRA